MSVLSTINMQRKNKCLSTVLLTLGVFFCFVRFSAGAFGDRVKLRDIDVLTLYSDRYTTGRRSSPIPQLKCVGGTAGCDSFKPQVVQCYNRGTDGYDVQWECKTDMDNAYRFGRVEVVCEGYDSPDDPYILRGSCGLEYTIDYTKEGYAQKYAHKEHDYYGNSYNQHHRKRNSNFWNIFKGTASVLSKTTSVFGDMIFLVLVAVIIYVIYRSCIAGSSTRPANPPPYSEHTSHTSMPQPPPSYSDYSSHASAPPPPTAPPPPGFRQEYVPNDGSSSSTSQNTNTGSNTGGGWWSGFTTGGLFGYLFGSGSNHRHHHHHHNHHTGWGWGNGGWGSGWGNRGWGSGWGSGWGGNRGYSSGWSSSRGGGGEGSWGGQTSGSSSSSSTGTRTASGFGGTRRR